MRPTQRHVRSSSKDWSGKDESHRARLRQGCGFRSHRRRDSLEHTRREDIDGNKDLTDITVLQLPLVALDRLGERICDYCGNGRTMSEIEGRFRRSGAPMVKEAFTMLRRQGRLEKARDKLGRTVYVAR